ncbi:MAG: hypothetical protein HUU02_08935 [Bacteroidetes bacterium]|nr:hypothetical protein [Bacteroidota bacterium]
MRTFIIIIVLLCASAAAEAQYSMQQLRSELTGTLAVDQEEPSVQPVVAERRSAATAVFYSLLLPGMGEYYAGGFDEGQYSLIAEGGLWLTWFSFRQYGSWLRDDARNFAAAHAGVSLSGKNDRYFVDLGNFNDIYEYNDKQLQDRELERVYDANSSLYWRWDSDQNRQEYRALRVSSEKVLNNAQFVIAGIVVNHIISAINAARLVRIANAQASEQLGSWWFQSSLSGNGLKPDGMTLSLIHRF